MTVQEHIITQEALSDIRDQHEEETIVFCTGCYDVVHAGHAVFFEQCASFGDRLVVGVGRDSTLEELKGDLRPVVGENNRVFLVAAFRDVDHAILNEREIVSGKIDFEEIIRELEPEIFVLNSDDSAIEEKQALCEEVGTEIKLVDRSTPEVVTPTSTTEIIQRIQRQS